MKTRLIYSFVLILFAASLQSQPLTWNTWNQVTTGTTSNLNFLYSDGLTKYYVIGDNGAMIVSSNTGATWSSLNTGFTNALKGFHFQSAATFRITGSNGLIAKTTNGGVNFTTQNSGTTNTLNSITSIGTSRSIAAGDNGKILQTTDGGVNWSAVSSGITTNLNYIIPYDGVKGLIIGDNGEIFKVVLEVPSLTFSFTRMNTGTALNLKHAVVIDANNIWVAASGGKLLRTTNAGVNWQVVNTGFSDNLYYISIHSQNMYVSGANGLLIKSTDGGATFTSMNSMITQDLKGIVVKNNIGVAIGNGGIAIRNIFSGAGGTFIKHQAQLDPSNISIWIQSSGTFNQDIRTSNTAGMIWPKGSAKSAIFTTGLSLAGFVNGELRMANASYTGEYTGGYIENGIAKTGTDFQVFIVKQGDNCYNSIEYANWQLMVPYGAPYSDVNGNGQYDACIDIPGVKNATQTVFVSLTDGFPQTHTPGEGFSGGTAPMKADVRLTAWGYQDTLNGTNLSDVLFFKWEIINKDNLPWTGFYSSVVCDPDLGEATNDYIGCDSTRNLGYCFNATNTDGIYGAAPPAVGMRMLKTPIRRNAGPNDTLPMTSFVYFTGSGSGGIACEQDPGSVPSGAYNYMRGVKRDGTPWLNAASIPPYQTKYCYTGDPETAVGWTEYTGLIKNCGGILTGNVEPSPPGDRTYVLSMGRDNFTFNPGDTQVVVMAQMIAKGSNNKNSVTKLKQLSDNVYNSFKGGNISIGINQISQIANSFMLYQNYPNPFNPVTAIKFQIPENTFTSLKIYDVVGKEISTIVNEYLSRGEYEYLWNANSFPSGIYFYRLETESYTQTRKMILVK